MGANKIDLTKDTIIEPKTIGCVKRDFDGTVVCVTETSKPKDISFKGTASATSIITLTIASDDPIYFMQVNATSNGGGSGYGGSVTTSLTVNDISYDAPYNTLHSSSTGVKLELSGLIHPTISVIYTYTETRGNSSSYFNSYSTKLKIQRNCFV